MKERRPGAELLRLLGSPPTSCKVVIRKNIPGTVAANWTAEVVDAATGGAPSVPSPPGFIDRLRELQDHFDWLD